MGQRDKGENWENVNSKSTGSGTDGMIFWRWRKKSVWNAGSFNCRYQSKLERFFFFFKKRERDIFWNYVSFFRKLLNQRSFSKKTKGGWGARKGTSLKSSMGYLCIISMNIKTPTN